MKHLFHGLTDWPVTQTSQFFRRKYAKKMKLHLAGAKTPHNTRMMPSFIFHIPLCQIPYVHFISIISFMLYSFYAKCSISLSLQMRNRAFGKVTDLACGHMLRTESVFCLI